MATTPEHPVSPFSRHARFVGRVGSLAVALGIGAAIANGAAPAAADDGTSSSESSASSAADSGPRQSANRPAKSPKASAAAAERSPASEDSGEDSKEDPDRDAGTDTEEDTGEDTDTDSAADDSADPDSADPDDEPRSARTTVKVGAVPSETTPSDTKKFDGEESDEPATPAPAAIWTLAGTGRPESAPDTSPRPETARQTTSPLGTEQQVEAEKLAAETVKTWPVRLMKLVLGLGWLGTANREYEAIGGPDRENMEQLWQSVDEYAMGAAFQQQLLNPMQPTVVTQVSAPHSWYGQDVEGSRILYDNPDTIYRFMGVNVTSTYVIKGKFSGAMPTDTSFSVLTGLSGVTAGILSGRELQLDADNSFTITVSGEPAAAGQRNHLQLTDDTTLIAVRNTMSDWTTQTPMSLSIERVSGPNNSLFSQLGGFAIPGLGPAVARSRLLTSLVSMIPPMEEPPTILRGAYTAIIMALGLGMESKYIKVATTDPETGERIAPNVLRNPSSNAEFLATQLQSAGYFELGDDEALVVTVTPGNARYFNVPVTNLWTVTDDYWNEQTSLNNAQAVRNADGSYTFVISPTDPGVHNWVSTGGLNQGTLSLRFQDLDPESSVAPTVRSQLVPLSDLAAVLPPHTAYVTEQERRLQLRIRKAAFDRRFAAPN